MWLANGCEDRAGVPCCVRDGGVPVDGADAEESECGVVGSEQDSEGVLGFFIRLCGLERRCKW